MLTQVSEREINLSESLIELEIDHLEGLHSNWNYGKILCTEVTKRILQKRYSLQSHLFVSILH